MFLFVADDFFLVPTAPGPTAAERVERPEETLGVRHLDLPKFRSRQCRRSEKMSLNLRDEKGGREKNVTPQAGPLASVRVWCC